MQYVIQNCLSGVVCKQYFVPATLILLLLLLQQMRQLLPTIQNKTMSPVNPLKAGNSYCCHIRL